MPIFVERLTFVDVPQPSRQTMVPLPHKEHLAGKVGKVKAWGGHLVHFKNDVRHNIGRINSV